MARKLVEVAGIIQEAHDPPRMDRVVEAGREVPGDGEPFGWVLGTVEGAEQLRPVEVRRRRAAIERREARDERARVRSEGVVNRVQQLERGSNWPMLCCASPSASRLAGTDERNGRWWPLPSVKSEYLMSGLDWENVPALSVADLICAGSKTMYFPPNSIPS